MIFYDFPDITRTSTVISIKDLIDLKLYSGRKQDLSDVFLLRSILEE